MKKNCSPAGQALRNAFFGQGTGMIVLDDVQCTGSEDQLLACSSGPILDHSSNCIHSQDAGVRCEGTIWYWLYISNYLATMFSVGIIELVDSICRDSTDTQYNYDNAIRSLNISKTAMYGSSLSAFITNKTPSEAKERKSQKWPKSVIFLR